MSSHAFRFGPLLTAMVTPMKGNLEVDYGLAAALARKLIEEGNDGLVVAGTTGESPTLTHEEKVKLFKTVKEAVGPAVPVIAGTGTYSTDESIRLTREAESLGMDGALVVCPYYNKPPQEGLYRHFKAIAESTKLPVMIYNIPSRTGVNMLPETAERLSEIPNMAGIKEASGSVEQVAEIARRVGAKAAAGRAADESGSRASALIAEKRFAIWSGDDGLTLPFLTAGASGVVSVAGHIVAPRLKMMIRAYFEGNVEEARAIHLELQGLFKALFITTNPIPVKAALRLAGFPVGGVRLPLVDAGEKEIHALSEAMRPLGLLSNG